MTVNVGANESGKSTFMDAVALALTGRINGRSVSEELNPHWFNSDVVAKYVQERKSGLRSALIESVRRHLFPENYVEA
jgi:putative ATP-dependent endonuclease of the OLD family